MAGQYASSGERPIIFEMDMGQVDPQPSSSPLDSGLCTLSIQHSSLETSPPALQPQPTDSNNSLLFQHFTRNPIWALEEPMGYEIIYLPPQTQPYLHLLAWSRWTAGRTLSSCRSTKAKR
eukprot:366910-Rhodomonas_salina.2